MTERTRKTRARGRLSTWHLLLLIPYVAVLWVPFYNVVEPSVFGFPFFYAYQMAWVIISSIITGIVYVATEG